MVKVKRKYDPDNDCYAYAIALAEKHDLKSIYVWINKDEYEPFRKYQYWFMPFHAFVKYKGHFLDHKGKLTLERLKQEFKHGNNIVRVNLREFKKWYEKNELNSEILEEVRGKVK